MPSRVLAVVASLFVHGTALAVAGLMVAPRDEMAPLVVDLAEPIDVAQPEQGAPRPDAGRQETGARERVRVKRASETPRKASPSAPAKIERHDVAPIADPATAGMETPPVSVPPPTEVREPERPAPAPSPAPAPVVAEPREPPAPPPPTVAAAPSPRHDAVTAPGGAPSPSASTSPMSASSSHGSEVPGARPGGSAPGHGNGDSGRLAALPGGGSAGTSAGGATSASVGGGGRGEPGAEYGGYLAQLRRRVQEMLRYPLVARRRGLTGTAHVELVILPTGTIARASVVKSSTHAVLDEAALESVRALPVMPFPAGLPPRQLVVRLPVVFALE